MIPGADTCAGRESESGAVGKGCVQAAGLCSPLGRAQAICSAAQSTQSPCRRRGGRTAYRITQAHCPRPLSPPRLQKAYLDALNKCGGLHEARPKTLLDMLQPQFPFLTLQVGCGAGAVSGNVSDRLGAVPAAAGRPGALPPSASLLAAPVPLPTSAPPHIHPWHTHTSGPRCAEREEPPAEAAHQGVQGRARVGAPRRQRHPQLQHCFG